MPDNFLRREKFKALVDEWTSGGKKNLSLNQRLRLAWLRSGDKTQLGFGKKIAALDDTGETKASKVKALLLKDPLFHGAYALAPRAVLGDRKVDHPMTPDEFMIGNFAGENGIRDFLARLEGRIPFGDGLEFFNKTSPGRFELSEARRRLVDQALSFLQAEDETPVMVVHAAGMCRGLTAFGKHIIDLPRVEKERPFLYLPISQMAEGGGAFDTFRFVAELHDFYLGRRDGAPSMRDRIRSDADVARAIEEIRREMACKAALVVIDGHIDRGPAEDCDNPGLRALHDLMVDDPLAGVLEHLLQPYQGETDSPSDVRIVQRNRFLILADGPCRWLAPYCSASMMLEPPPPEATLRLINDKRIFQDPEAVVDFARATGSHSEIELHLADSCVAHGVSPADAGTGEGLARALLAALRANGGHDYLVLVLVALTPGGLRHGILLRLLEQWRKVQAVLEAPTHLRCAAALSAADIVKTIGRLKGIFHSVEDDTMAATLAEDYWLEDLHAVVDAGRRQSNAKLETIAFRIPKMRETILTALLEQAADHSFYALLNGLLAEESLRQHTLLMRHGERLDSTSIRANRRLTQALYHGFLSLHASEKQRTAVATALPCVLPAPLAKAFVRLYGVFYRNLLEAPPHWEVSRVMSADSAKCDLLLLAANCLSRHPEGWRCSLVGLPGPIPDSLPDWMTTVSPPEGSTQIDDVAEQEKLRIAREEELRGRVETLHDMLVALAKAAAEQNRFQLVQAANQAATQLRTAFPTVADNARLTDALQQLRKIAADTLIQSEQNLAGAQEMILDQLKDVGVPPSLTDELSSLAATLAPWATIDEAVAKAASDMRNNLAPAGDLFARYAESLVPESELRIAHGEEPKGGNHYQQLLRKAYLYFRLAVACRRNVVWSNPLSRQYVASGHWSRSYVRMLLLMIELREHGPYADLPSKADLFLEARKEADVLVRYFSRYPVERPSVMILEALIALCVGKDAVAARRLLGEADSRMAWVSDRPRLRMRLIAERVQVSLGLSETAPDEDITARYKSAAVLDSRRLTRLAADSDSAFWIKLAANEASRVQPAVEYLDVRAEALAAKEKREKENKEVERSDDYNLRTRVKTLKPAKA